VPEPEPLREDLAAAVAARRDLGPDYEDAVLESFLARLDQAVAARVDAQVAERTSPSPADRGAGGRQLALGIVSLVLGIPVTAIATSNAEGLGALAVSWAGIAAVNAAHAWTVRRNPLARDARTGPWPS
jgi:hypothetical protein